MNLFNNFYQMGFVARDLDHATTALGKRYGISQFRRKRSSDWLQTAHAWIGDLMIEVMQIGDGAPPIYGDYIPDEPSAIRLHHHGFRVPDLSAWAEVEKRVDAAGLPTPMKGAVMNGDLSFMYVDTRADLGIYSEYVCLKGSALNLYDDVPRNS